MPSSRSARSRPVGRASRDAESAVPLPTLARTALPIEHKFFDLVEIDGEPVDTMRRAWYPYTLPFNMTGNPAMSVPCGWDAEWLPIGLQLIGRLGADAMLCVQPRCSSGRGRGRSAGRICHS